MFLRSLPDKISIVVAATTSGLRDLALEADRHFATSGMLIATTHSTINKVHEPTPEVHTSFRPRRATRNRQHAQTGLCYYHAAFGSACQRPLVYTAASHPSKLFRVHDSQSGESYLVDTCAEISILPPTDYDRKFRTRGSPLRAANNTDIASFGERTNSLKLGTNTLCWKFNVADVSQPILGAGFLCHHGLLIDVRRRRLNNAYTFETTEAFAVSDKVPSVSVVKLYSAAQDFERLIDERPALTCPTFSNATPRHGVEHHISTEGAPVFARARRLSPEKLAYAKNANA